MKSHDNKPALQSDKLEKLKNAVLSNLWQLKLKNKVNQKVFDDFITKLVAGDILTRNKRYSIASNPKTRTSREELTKLIENTDLTKEEQTEFKEFCGNIEKCRVVEAKGGNALAALDMNPVIEAINTKIDNDKKKMLPLVIEKSEEDSEKNQKVDNNLASVDGEQNHNHNHNHNQEEGVSVAKKGESQEEQSGSEKGLNLEINEGKEQPKAGEQEITEDKVKRQKLKKIKGSKSNEETTQPNTSGPTSESDDSGVMKLLVTNLLISLYLGCEKNNDKRKLVTEFLSELSISKGNRIKLNEQGVDEFIAAAKRINLIEDIKQASITIDQAQTLKERYSYLEGESTKFLNGKNQFSDVFNLKPIGTAIDAKISELSTEPRDIKVIDVEASTAPFPLGRSTTALALNVASFMTIVCGATLFSQAYFSPFVINKAAPWLAGKGFASVVPYLTYQVHGVNPLFAALSVISAGLLLPKISNCNKTDDTKAQSRFLTIGALPVLLFFAHSAYTFNGFSKLPTLTNGWSVQSVVPLIIMGALAVDFISNSWNNGSVVEGVKETSKDLGFSERKFNDLRRTNLLHYPELDPKKSSNPIRLGSIAALTLVTNSLLKKGLFDYFLPFARNNGYDLVLSKNAKNIASFGCLILAAATVAGANIYWNEQEKKCAKEGQEKSILQQNFANFFLASVATITVYECFNTKIPGIILAAAVVGQYIYSNNSRRNYTSAENKITQDSGILLITK